MHNIQIKTVKMNLNKLGQLAGIRNSRIGNAKANYDNVQYWLVHVTRVGHDEKEAEATNYTDLTAVVPLVLWSPFRPCSEQRNSEGILQFWIPKEFFPFCLFGMEETCRRFLRKGQLSYAFYRKRNLQQELIFWRLPEASLRICTVDCMLKENSHIGWAWSR